MKSSYLITILSCAYIATDYIPTVNYTDYIPTVNYTDYIPTVNYTDYIPTVNYTDYIPTVNYTDDIQDTLSDKCFKVVDYLYKYLIEILLTLILLADLYYNQPQKVASKVYFNNGNLQKRITKLLSDNKPRMAKDIMKELELNYSKHILNTEYLYPMRKKGTLKIDKSWSWTLKN
jgi:hypothetical protein